MEKSRVTNFERCAAVSGLLTREQLAQARSIVRAAVEGGNEPQDRDLEQHLAEKLVELGFLNVWQAKQLLDGRTKFTLGPYKIIDSLGRGGMGQVFKGEHSLLGRIVAIKVLPVSKATPDAIASFTREIRAQASLDHENLVRALDADTDGNVYYLVTEYVPGADLRRLVRRTGPLSMANAASVISQVALGLDHAHQRGMIHRDVKPGNVLVTPEGHAKLSDLGLAGPLEGGAQADPRFGKIVGTADYLSPDHIRSPWDPTPAWDIYSLGCTMYYAVTGKVPFPSGTTADKARAHCELLPPDPRCFNRNLNPDFVEVLADMMAKDPAERIPSATEVIVRLNPWTGQPQPISPPAQGVTVRRPRGMVWSSSTVASGVEASQTVLKDTEVSFPEFKTLASPQSPNDTPVEHPRAPAPPKRPAATPAAATPAAEPTSMIGPLMVLVALPLAVVALLVLLRFLL